MGTLWAMLTADRCGGIHVADPAGPRGPTIRGRWTPAARTSSSALLTGRLPPNTDGTDTDTASGDSDTASGDSEAVGGEAGGGSPAAAPTAPMTARTARPVRVARSSRWRRQAAGPDRDPVPHVDRGRRAARRARRARPDPRLPRPRAGRGGRGAGWRPAAPWPTATTSTHRPGLADHVRARDVRCRFPGCRRERPTPNSTTSQPASDGADQRTQPRRRTHHHRLKTHAAGWRVHAHPHGLLTWTTPTGHRHTTEPHDYRPDAAAEPETDTRAHAPGARRCRPGSATSF